MSYHSGHAPLEVMSGDGGSLERPQTQRAADRLALRGLFQKQLIPGFEVIRNPCEGFVFQC